MPTHHTVTSQAFCCCHALEKHLACHPRNWQQQPRHGRQALRAHRPGIPKRIDVSGPSLILPETYALYDIISKRNEQKHRNTHRCVSRSNGFLAGLSTSSSRRLDVLASSSTGSAGLAGLAGSVSPFSSSGVSCIVCHGYRVMRNHQLSWLTPSLIIAYPKQKINVFGYQILFGYLIELKNCLFRLPFSDIVFGWASNRKRESIF